MTLIAQNGGTIKIKGAFPNDYGGFGQPDATDMMNALEARKKQLTSPEDVVEELDQWYQTQIRVIADYKYMFEKGTDFLK